MKTIQTAYLIALPDIGLNPAVFSFLVNTQSGVFELTYRWDVIAENWLLYVTLPDGSVRQAGVYPNTMSWTGYLDFGFYIQSDLANIGQNDLPNTAQYLVVWQ
jgi:hypothetical protein